MCSARRTQNAYPTRRSALKAIKVIYQRITMMKLMRCVVAKVVSSGYCRWRLFLLYSTIHYTHCHCHTHFLLYFFLFSSSSSSFFVLLLFICVFFAHSSAFSRLVGDSPVIEKWFRMCKRVWVCVCRRFCGWLENPTVYAKEILTFKLVLAHSVQLKIGIYVKFILSRV